jgi:hypothetical protein
LRPNSPASAAPFRPQTPLPEPPQEDEAPSDFQDYTLVAVVAVASHLLHGALGDNAALEALAARYGHDAKSLDQVWRAGR